MSSPARKDRLDAAGAARVAAELARLKRDALAGVARADGELRGEDADLFRDGGLTGDGALAEAEFERDVAGAGQARSVLFQIVAAERRLVEGEYGICVDCGNDIGAERLAAQPAASRCVQCQDMAERRGARPPLTG
jgi:RNA polymerase-binding transcription factor DksA